MVHASILRDSQQLFVGNLPHNCTDDELVELFSKYGKVNDVRINQKQARADATRGGRDGKQSFVSSDIHMVNFQRNLQSAQVPNFGFIVFAEAESVEKALNAKPILLYGNHRLNVEEKKMRTPRDSTGPSGFSDRDRQDMGKRGSQVNILKYLKNNYNQITTWLGKYQISHILLTCSLLG